MISKKEIMLRIASNEGDIEIVLDKIEKLDKKVKKLEKALKEIK